MHPPECAPSSANLRARQNRLRLPASFMAPSASGNAGRSGRGDFRSQGLPATHLPCPGTERRVRPLASLPCISWKAFIRTPGRTEPGQGAAGTAKMTCQRIDLFHVSVIMNGQGTPFGPDPGIFRMQEPRHAGASPEAGTRAATAFESPASKEACHVRTAHGVYPQA